jgi:ATP-dependent RNA helicase DDX18/HAS1
MNKQPNPKKQNKRIQKKQIKKKIPKKQPQTKVETKKPIEDGPVTVNLDNINNITETLKNHKQNLQQQQKETVQSEEDFGLLSNDKFSELDLHPLLHRGISEALGFERMTHIQAKSIPHLLSGRDIIGGAQTGSGKTLAFLVPAIQMLYKLRIKPEHGTVIMIISPVRELTIQIYDVAKKLLQFDNSKTVGLIHGGSNTKMERMKISKSPSLIISTPGRLLDHLLNTSGFKFDNLSMLVMDEADQILKEGFREELNRILGLLPKERQTVLFSATQTKSVEDLVRMSMKSPVYVETQAKQRTVDGLEQGFVICPSENRFRLLLTFLKANLKKKVMVFFSSCNSVKFHSNLLNYIDVKVLEIHGKQKQQKRQNTYYEFCNMEKGILLCTNVAARGLDIPSVDWIVQFDPPDETREYIHRVGRTCRGTNKKGKALLFLLPSEKKYLQYLKADKVELSEFEYNENKLCKVQAQFIKLVENNYFLNQDAKESFKSYMNAYVSHSMKDVFEVNDIDLNKAALAFGLTCPPKLNLDVSFRSKKKSFKKNFGKK